MPPRHGKTYLTSKLFPAWFMGRNPKRQIILASHSAPLAETNSRRARDYLTSPVWPFPNAKLSAKAQGVQRWETEQGGSLLAAGVGGKIQGFGANVLLIDDPVGGVEEADSILMRDKAWDWYQEDARPRLEPGGAIVVIMTRWHEDDLIGRLMNTDSGWVSLVLPAIAEENDPLGRQVGEALWPERIPLEELPSVEKGEISTRTFIGLYQQRPSLAAGNIFDRKWWKTYQLQEAPNLKASVITIDSAFKDGVQNDFSVAAVWGFQNGCAYLIDIWRKRVQFPELCEGLRELYRNYKAPLIIEDAASGQSLLQVLTRPLPNQPAIPVVSFRLPHNMSKTSRASAVTRYIEAGLVYLPEKAPWLDEFIEEHSSFPNAAHDDMVDTTAIALRRLFGENTRQGAGELVYNKAKTAKPGSRLIEAIRANRLSKAEENWKQRGIID